MVMCFVPGCNHYSERKTCKFFVFPADPTEKKKWINLIRRQDREPSKYSLVCSCHFINNERRNRPTIFEFNIKKKLEFDSIEKRLPVDNDTRAIWLSKLRGKHQEESIPKKATICSTHFKIEDFSIKPNGKKYLRSEALPLFYGDGNVESEPQSSGPLSIENSSSQKNVLIIEINNEVASVLDCSEGDSSATETAPFSPSDTLTASEFELYSPPPFSLCEESTAMPENNEDENIKVKEEVEETEDKSNMDIPSQIFNDSREEVNDIEDKENEELPSQMFNKSRLKVIRYFGDIEIDDLEYPETRETCFNIINKTINKQKQKIKNLEAKNRRLVDKMYSMKSVTDHVIKTNANKQIPSNISRASSEESEADINLWGYEDLKGCAEQIHDNMARLQKKLDEVVLLMKQKFPKLPIPNLRVRTAFYRKRQRRKDRFGASAAVIPKRTRRGTNLMRTSRMAKSGSARRKNVMEKLRQRNLKLVKELEKFPETLGRLKVCKDYNSTQADF